MKMWTDNYVNKDCYQQAIVLKENGNEPLGTISVVGQNEKSDIVHIGYCIGSAWWNKSITSDALKELFRFSLTKAKVNRIESQHSVGRI